MLLAVIANAMFLFGIIITFRVYDVCVCVCSCCCYRQWFCYFTKHWNCLACNSINNDDIKSIFDNGKCLLQRERERARWKGHFHWAFPILTRSHEKIGNNSCHSNDLWWICSAHTHQYMIYYCFICSEKGKKTILKFRKENAAHI